MMLGLSPRETAEMVTRQNPAVAEALFGKKTSREFAMYLGGAALIIGAFCGLAQLDQKYNFYYDTQTHKFSVERVQPSQFEAQN